MRLISPDDDFLLLTDTEHTPMQIGSLQFYDVPDDRRDGFAQAVRTQFERRLPLTPLLAVRHQAPLRFDSDAWLAVAACDLERHVVEVGDNLPLTRAQLLAFVADKVMERLDLSRPPFMAYVAPRLAEGGSAIFFKMHHGVADGVGFQTVLKLLTDDRPESDPSPAPKRRGERPPWAPLWLVGSAWRLLRLDKARRDWATQRDVAQEALTPFRKDPALRRPKAPVLKLSARPTSHARVYETLSLPLQRFRDVGRKLGGTVNDVFLAVGSGALRRLLLDLDDLPETPLVINSARSYRRPEHGDFGNRIVALHPHLATHLADPKARFAEIRRSMETELARSRFEERLLGSPEVPFGPKKRADTMAKVMKAGRVLPGNVTLSNVPGPDTPRYLAGFRQTGNYPTPILGMGTFLNITMRRNGDMLDMGVMADRKKIADLASFKAYLVASLEELEAAAQ